ncbi:helix-turn-helix domain-containing protein [Kitasatospora sp. NBC_01266]|uniref:helix-turn-helix domain-containing protein n=1 Tax=Kitasatospora sp. NBC_01266 TaxID=2903572 RepID=UPI002E37AA64|nr:helix-turn-helix domain-containing protein [Kitasatospora sp. NBC_01266]
MTDGLSIGERIAWYRRRRGMSQEVLAGLVGRSTDWLSKVENDRIAMDRLAVIRSVADALRIRLGDLLDEPSVQARRATARASAVEALRDALTDYRRISPVLDHGSNGGLIELDVLDARLRSAWDACQHAHYSVAVHHLPSLLAHTHQAAQRHHGNEQLRAYSMLALTHHLAATVLARTGEADLAWIAADRGLTAAQHGGDPLVIGSLFRSVAHSLLSCGRFTAAQDVTTDAASYLTAARHPASPAFLSVYGTLLLVGAMAAARDGERAAVQDYMRGSDRAAGQLGHDANYLWTAFGPTNVAIHQVSTAAELGDVHIALDLGPSIEAAGLPVERQVRHKLEVARAHSARNRFDDALTIVLAAEQLSPEQVRDHFISRQLVGTWVRTIRGKPSLRLAALAQRLQILE